MITFVWMALLLLSLISLFVYLLLLLFCTSSTVAADCSMLQFECLIQTRQLIFFLLFRLSIKVLDCCRDSVASLEAGLCYLSKLEQRQVNSCSRSVYLFSSAASRKPHSPDLQLTCCLSNVLVRLKSRNVDPLHLSMFCRGHFYILPAISLYTPLIL